MENYNNIMNPGYTNIVYGNSMLQTSHQIPENPPLVQQNLQSDANIENNMDSENTPLENENSILECENLKSTNENVILNNETNYVSEELPKVNAFNESVVIENEVIESKTLVELPNVVEELPKEVEPPEVVPEKEEVIEDEIKTEIEIECTNVPEIPLVVPPVIIKKKEVISTKSRSKPKETTVSAICRVCLKPGELINIFNKDGTLKLHDKVMLCAAVQITPKDGLPTKICTDCVDKLQVAYEFKITCESSDLELRKRLKKSTPAKTVVKTEFVLIECDNDFDMDDEPLAPAPKRKYKEDSEDFLVSESAPDSGSDSSFALNKSKSKRRQRKKRVSKRSLPKRELRSVEKKKESSRRATSTPTISTGSTAKRSKKVIEEDDDEDDRPLIIRKLNQNEIATKHACKICKKTFPYASFLKQHMMTHTSDKIIRCKFCTATFTKRSDQQKHNNDFHAEDLDEGLSEVIPTKETIVKEVVVREKKQHKCPYCEQVFTSANLLRQHKRTHVGEKPFVCNICNKGFKQTVSLESHIKRHKEDKSLQCELCDKYCLTKVELKKHIHETHGEEKPFTCDQCDKTFSTKVRLEKHVVKHEKEELELSGSVKDDGKKKAPSTKDLFKSIAPITSTYWSDSYSD